MKWRNEDQRFKMLKACGFPKRYLLDFLGEEFPMVDITQDIFLFGPTGCGKTFAACHYLEKAKLKDSKKTIYFTTVDDLLLSMRVDIAKEAQKRLELREPDHLCLDDLSTERVTDWTWQAMDNIVDFRYREMKPTIITSNYDLKWISSHLSERIASRISESYQIIEMVGEDRRLK